MYIIFSEICCKEFIGNLNLALDNVPYHGFSCRKLRTTCNTWPVGMENNHHNVK